MPPESGLLRKPHDGPSSFAQKDRNMTIRSITAIPISTPYEI
jgi:hypothetical protein